MYIQYSYVTLQTVLQIFMNTVYETIIYKSAVDQGL
jgi:hypothetical protein